TIGAIWLDVGPVEPRAAPAHAELGGAGGGVVRLDDAKTGVGGLCGRRGGGLRAGGGHTHEHEQQGGQPRSEDAAIHAHRTPSGQPGTCLVTAATTAAKSSGCISTPIHQRSSTAARSPSCAANTASPTSSACLRGINSSNARQPGRSRAASGFM